MTGDGGTSAEAAPRVDGIVEAMAVLRSRCPWSSEQDHASLEKYAREETEELIEALADFRASPGPATRQAVIDELGDVLYQVLFHSALLDESGGEDYGHSLGAVIDGLEAKLVRRHPFAFDGQGRGGPMASLEDVEAEYRRIKDDERVAADESEEQ
ncbi:MULTISPECIES: MazG nucleotide pyrophosphohydrolase domain-containing protein [Brevibacterium]|uniref:MazG family protein n=2 Tax=Brevibacterium casei TaxID=33889 RepID=K9B2R1_9MICO|nr:MazG nucleotide pyrophosphohydrolase domain-containing protein [Brevibacterium casei]NJE66226.1 MazG family protein [Brevibacterium sp. LS14]SIJ04131.1 nucleoside triphosphate pyrophosphohydrolase [Mycobacteroides abscessus subsp. abscessus]EKU49102.1 mazG family protein [Brevibacterium casei S18]KZE18408.1 MazG family protein [Brevibacterium casei]MBE4695995.1 MazG family protein [Brevibacterium casei]